jgi:lantibiotic modifying enzyme
LSATIKSQTTTCKSVDNGGVKGIQLFFGSVPRLTDKNEFAKIAMATGAAVIGFIGFFVKLKP